MVYVGEEVIGTEVCRKKEDRREESSHHTTQTIAKGRQNCREVIGRKGKSKTDPSKQAVPRLPPPILIP